MSTTIQHTCRKAEDGSGNRLLNLEHLRDCNLSGCPGCKPCEPRWGHCTRCKAEHLDADHPRTCARCVGAVRNDVLTIADQITEAHDQQVYRAVGSIAFMLTAPAGNYEAGAFVHQSAIAGRLCRCRKRGLPTCAGDIPPGQGPTCQRACQHPTCYAIRNPPACPDRAFILEELRLDEMHPFTVFGAWELTWRRHLNIEVHPEEMDKHTTWSSARFILEHLTTMAQLPEEESDFDQLAEEVADSRHWLEDVLRLGDRPDRAGLCPMCKKERLVKDWDPEDEGTAYTPERDGKAYGDLWYCPNSECGQTYSPEEYGDRLNRMWVDGADRLPAAELAHRIRVPRSTIRDWASTRTRIVTPARVVDGELVDAVKETIPPRLRSCGRDGSGRKLYRVKDAEALRDNTTRKATA